MNIARRERPDVLASATALPFAPNTFKTIVMLQTFHQIPEGERISALEELVRLDPDRIVIHDYQKKRNPRTYSILTQFFSRARIIPHQGYYLLRVIDRSLMVGKVCTKDDIKVDDGITFSLDDGVLTAHA